MKNNKVPFWVPKVRAIMKKKGITLDDLAGVMKVKTRGAVGHYFSGRRQMTIERMVMLANIVGIDIKEMIQDPQQRTVKEFPAAYQVDHDSSIPFSFMCPIISFDRVQEHIDSNNYTLTQDQEFVSIARKVSDKTFAVKLVSDNMTSSIINHISFIPGDIIIFDPLVSAEINDYVLCQESRTDSFLFRQLCSEGSKSFLKALNAQYNHISYDTEEVKIIAVAMAKLNMLR